MCSYDYPSPMLMGDKVKTGSLSLALAAGAAARYARTPPRRKDAMRAASPHAMVLMRPSGKGLKDSGRHPPGCPAAPPSWIAAGAGGPRSPEAGALPGRRQKPPGRGEGMALLIATGPCQTELAMPGGRSRIRAARL